MPIKLIEPRKGKSPNFTFRGTYLGVYVDKSSGTDRRSIAAERLKELRRQIERGEYEREAVPRTREPTFLSAAVAYMEAGRSPRYVARLIKHFGSTPLTEMNQEIVDEAAIALCPGTTPANRNRQVYIPTSAILRHAGLQISLKRPKGAKGRTLTDALNPDDAAAVIRAAESFDAEYALLLKFLLYTGCRLGEALRLEWSDVRLGEATVRVRTSKNGDPREMVIRDDLLEGLKKHQSVSPKRVFRFHQGGWLKWLLLRAKLMACGLPVPPRPKKGQRRKIPKHRLSWCNHHSFRHTFATWMRRYGGADIQGLVATGHWRDQRSAARYAHAVPRDEWDRVHQLPAISKTGT